MTRRASLALWLAAVGLVSLGCGRPAAVGDRCDGDKPVECVGSEAGSAAYWCDSGRLVLIACKGPGKCTANSGVTTCDRGRPVQGDACLKAEENHSYCDQIQSGLKLRCVPLNGPAKYSAEPCKGCTQPTLHETSCQP